MSSTEHVGAGRIAWPAMVCVGLSVLLTLNGCSLLPHQARANAAPPPPIEPPAQSAPPEPQTDTDVVADQAPQSDEADSTTVMTAAETELKPTAPKNYVVQRGDTLWGIANMFLRNPWQWPEIWYVNPQIHNPHRIYPGDMVRLALATNGRTVLQIVRGPAALAAAHLEPLLRSSALDQPIEAIPYDLIAAFISHPGVLTDEQVQRAPYIVALAQNHDIAGDGNEIYVKKLAADPGARFSVMHVDEPLVDPASGRHLGYVAIYTGTAQITRQGRIAEAVIVDSARETLQGDVLVVPERTPTSDFVPHPPAQSISGEVIDVVDNVQLAGQYDVVVLNRGSDDGLDRGSVLTVDQEAEQATDLCATIGGNSTCLLHPTETLPVDPAGSVLVFRTYPHLSYALVLGDAVPVQLGDHVHSP